MINVIQYADFRSFQGAVFDRLLEREAENCWLLGTIQACVERGYKPNFADDLEQPLLLAVKLDDRVESIAIQTTSKSLLLARGSTEAMECLADDLMNRKWTGQAVVGPTPSVDELARRYVLRSGCTAKMGRQLRCFQTSSVRLSKPVEGAIQMCTAQDRDTLLQFVVAYGKEIGEGSDADAPAIADRFIETQRAFFWIVNGRAVSMAAWSGKTPNGVRINYVYTPMELRGQGYASNVTAQLTQRLLDQGRKFCFLFTDQSNPTSNSIYQKIGYEPVSEGRTWKFD